MIVNKRKGTRIHIHIIMGGLYSFCAASHVHVAHMSHHGMSMSMVSYPAIYATSKST